MYCYYIEEGPKKVGKIVWNPRAPWLQLSFFVAGDLESYVLMWTVYTLNHLLIIPGIFVCLARSETRVYVKRIITNISLRQCQNTATVTPSTLAQPNTKY